MSGSEEPHRPYGYTLRVPAQERTSGPALEALFSIKDTLLLLTSDCEVTLREDGRFCGRHGLPVDDGSERCGYLATRFTASVDEQKTQIQRYVNEVLGVKDPRTVKRLTG